VHGQECRTQLCDALHAFCHRVADVVQLQVEKHLLTGCDQPSGKGQAASKSKLISDLVKPDRIAEARNHRLGGRHRRYVECNDQPLTRIQRHD
jgi:hypothetical protein